LLQGCNAASAANIIRANRFAFARTVSLLAEAYGSGRIPRNESIVLSITGKGCRTLEAAMQSVKKPYRIKIDSGELRGAR
jgi:hypothetical protein